MRKEQRLDSSATNRLESSKELSVAAFASPRSRVGASVHLRRSGRRRLGWAVAMSTTLALVAVPTASGSGGHSLAIVSPKELSLSPDDKTETVVVRNDGPAVGGVHFFASPEEKIVVTPART